MSISSTLIQACLSNVQKEFKQLEHWLNSLHPPPTTIPVDSNLESAIRELSTKIDTLSKQYDTQQLALNHIVDRLDMLERGRFHQMEDQSPWLDTDGLENTIIEPIESIYVVHKEDTPRPNSPVISMTVPPVSPNMSALNTGFYVEPITHVVEEQPVVKVEPVEPAQPAQNTTIQEIHRDEDDEIEDEENTQEEPQEVEPQKEEPQEVEEEEEDDGVELSEITFKDKTYYKDGENFVYGIDDEGQPTEQPIGIWKEKTQSVAFYRLK